MPQNHDASYRDLVEKLDKANRALSRELAEHKQTEAVLRESEKKYRTLYTSSRDAVMLLRPGHGFISGNPATLEMFKCKNEDEFITKTPAELSPLRQPDGELSSDKSEAMIALAVENGSHFFEWTHRRLDGDEFPATVLLTRMTLEGQTVLQATVRDITESKQMEARLRQSEKMQAIGQIAGGIAHDFNNRLVSIQGFAQLLYEESTIPKHKDYAQRILTGAKRAAHLTSQLLAFARKGDYQSIPVNIHELITEVVMFLEHSIDKRIHIVMRPEANSPIVKGDPSQLQNVLLNLALNARDAMPNGGKIEFATAVVRADAIEDLAKESPQADFLKIRVSDTGTGMDEATREHIFEPFFTTKKPDSGTGMGLASVYGAVQNHGGAITVQSTPGKGSVFTIFLPLAKKTEKISSVPANTPAVNGSAHILLVEDEEDVRDFIAIALRKLGYEVVTQDDGLSATQYYRNAWQKIDLVILDMIMPKLDGRQTFSAMLKINPKLKAILATGYDMDHKMHDILEQGVCGFVQKPFNLSELSQAVSRALRE